MDATRARNLGLGLLGALAGAALGYWAFFWIAHHGFYAMVLPGALAGLGGGLPVKDRSILRAAFCGALALGLGLFTEWRFRPFIADRSLGYFMTHLHQLQAVTLMMVAAGAVLGAWLALGRNRASGNKG